MSFETFDKYYFWKLEEVTGKQEKLNAIKLALNEILEGYSTVEEAEEESKNNNMVRFTKLGFRITPDMLRGAIEYAKTLPSLSPIPFK